MRVLLLLVLLAGCASSESRGHADEGSPAGQVGPHLYGRFSTGIGL